MRHNPRIQDRRHVSASVAHPRWHGALLPPVLALMAEAVAEITRLPIWQHPRAGCHNLPTMSSACTRWHTEQSGRLSAHGPVPACPRQRLRLLRVFPDAQRRTGIERSGDACRSYGGERKGQVKAVNGA